MESYTRWETRVVRDAAEPHQSGFGRILAAILSKLVVLGIVVGTVVYMGTDEKSGKFEAAPARPVSAGPDGLPPGLSRSLNGMEVPPTPSVSLPAHPGLAATPLQSSSAGPLSPKR